VPNRLISEEEDPQRLLLLVADKLDNFDHINVATAFSKLGKLRASGSFPRNIAADDGFRGLMGLARAMCADGRLQAQAVANIIHAVSKMSAAGKLDAADADVQDTLTALEQRVVRVASDMESQNVSNTVYSFAVLGREPGAEALAALEFAVMRVGPDMVPQAVANTAWSFATLGLMPGAEARTALEAAVMRVGPGMNGQNVANTAWSFATLGLMPGAEARAALEAAAVRVSPRMNAQDVANTAWSFATLGLMPGAEAQAALESAVVRTSPSMTPQELANKLRSFLTLAATLGVPLPACYPSLWRAACGLDVGALKDVDLRMLFHAQMIHAELVSGDVLKEVTFPPWIMHEAREAWMRNARGDVTVSRSHKEIAAFIGELGILCEVECLSDCGKFSVDIVLPDHDVAVEFDGPEHFITFSDGGEGAAPDDASRTSTKTPSTELRDMFLSRRYRKVITVPWFEWSELNGKGAAEKRKYVAAKLREVGVSIPAST